jgi:hypothetical protein
MAKETLSDENIYDTFGLTQDATAVTGSLSLTVRIKSKKPITNFASSIILIR